MTATIQSRPPGATVFVRLALAFVLSMAVPSCVAAWQNPHGADPHHGVEAPMEVEEGVHYRVYDRWGNRTSLKALVGSSADDDVLLVGEEHGDGVGHAVEDLLLETVLQEIGVAGGAGRPVVLSMEMFERDVQYIVDEYLAGLISEDHFLRSSRPWDDYASRYRPLVERARAHGVPVLAANAPRRYVNRVTNEGPGSLAALPAEGRRHLPPLPYPGPSPLYREQWDAIMSAAMEGMRDAEGLEDTDDVEATDDEPHREEADTAGEAEGEAAEGEVEADEARGYTMNPNAIYSQALWDASMGHAITQALVRHMDGFVMHVSGSFHVARGTGIPERIEDYRPGTEVTTVVMTRAEDIDAWSEEDHAPLADFVVLTRSAR